MEADLTSGQATRRLFEQHKPNGVIHLAAKAGVRPSIADPAGYMHANVTGTAVILAEAHRAGCSRAVVASSSSVYGDSCTPPYTEAADVSCPISPYAASKRACELLGHAHWHLTGMPTAMLRFFTVYGPRQRPDLAIAKFIRCIRDHRPIDFFGDGSMSRDFTFIDDIVAGVLAAHDRIDSHGYRIWNLGSDAPVTLSDMLATIESALAAKATLNRLPVQPGDVKTTWADLTRSRQELGYSPSTPFAVGIQKQVEWTRGRGG